MRPFYRARLGGVCRHLGQRVVQGSQTACPPGRAGNRRVGTGPHRISQQRPQVPRVTSARAGDGARGGYRAIKVTLTKPGLDVQPGERECPLGFGLSSGKRAKLGHRPCRDLHLAPRGGDLAPADQQVLAAERRQILGEALLNHVQSLVPAARRGQRLGQVRRDRRRHIPGQAKLPGPGKIGPSGLDRGLVQAVGLQPVGDLHPGQQLQRPGPDPLRSCRRFLQVRDNFAAGLPAHVGQPDLRLDPERFVT